MGAHCKQMRAACGSGRRRRCNCTVFGSEYQRFGWQSRMVKKFTKPVRLFVDDRSAARRRGEVEKFVRTLPSLIAGLAVDIVGSADEANFRVKAVSKDRSDETLEPNYNVSDRRLRYVRRNSDASQVLLSNSCQFPRRSRIPCRDRSLPLALGPHIRREYHAPVLVPVLHHAETQTSMGKDMDGDQEVLTDLASFCAFR